MELALQFKELGIDNRLLSVVDHLGFEGATDIQLRAIPAMLTGVDIMATSKTGSGKTLAYLLPAVQRVLKQRALSKKDPRVLILAPTRELAKQVFGQLRLLTAGSKVKSVLILGGENFNDQVKTIAKEPEFIVATPGRLADHLGKHHFYLNGLELLILDEADRMLDLGFAEQLQAIHQAADHRKRQTVLFSATLNHGQVEDFAISLLNKPKRITVDSANAQHKDIKQRFYLSEGIDHKHALLNHLLSTEDITQLIIFTATRADTERLANQLNEKGFDSVALSGDLNQSKRNAIMESFSRGQHKVLITTDLASRGLDLVNVSHVINFDLPKHAEEYVHRIGRTGRAGQQGDAFSFVGPNDWLSLKAIEQFLAQGIDFTEIEGLESRFKGLREKSAKQASNNPKSASIKSKKATKHSKAKSRNTTFYTAKDAGDMPVLKRKKAQVIDDDNSSDADEA